MPWKTPVDVESLYARLLLQFGHGGDAVENPARPPRSCKCTIWLQFGHGGDAVENGTAAVDVAALDLLQFGHGGDAVENFISFR